MSKALIALNSDEYLFRRISSSGNRKRLVSVNKPISYSVYRDSFKKSFSDIVSDISRFSTHSTRSGGATLAANSGVSERNIQRHGRGASVEISMLKTRYLAGLKSLNLCPSELKPFCHLAWDWLTDVAIRSSVILCVRLCSGGKIS